MAARPERPTQNGQNAQKPQKTAGLCERRAVFRQTGLSCGTSPFVRWEAVFEGHRRQCVSAFCAFCAFCGFCVGRWIGGPMPKRPLDSRSNASWRARGSVRVRSRGTVV